LNQERNLDSQTLRTRDFYDAFRRANFPDETTDEILTNLSRRLKTFFNRNLPFRHEADIHDGLQETIYRMLKGLIPYDESRSFWPWVYGIARHVACEMRRKAQNERGHLQAYARTQSVDHCVDRSVEATLHGARRALEERSKLKPRTIAVGWDAHMSVSAAEVALTHGVPINRVRVAKHRVLRALTELVAAGEIRE
jgi:DNA-directed RNA polymerase specialized sigma24 family protein